MTDITEGPVPHTGLYVGSESEILAPFIEFDTDDTYGIYIKRMGIGDLTWTFAPVPMFAIGLWNIAAEEEIEIVDGSWQPVITTDVGTGVITLVFTSEDYPDIDVTATMLPIEEGYRVSYVMNTDSLTYGVAWFVFPFFGCQPHSGSAANAWLSHGFVGGLVHTTPHTISLGPTQEMHSPSSMQFMDYFDIETRAHFYLGTDDEDGYSKGWPVLGDGSFVTRIGSKHYLKNPRRAKNTLVALLTTHLEVTYHLNISMFRGRTEDGRCGHYDSALRYRTWVLSAAPYWITLGSWMDDPGISQLVKDSDFYYVSGSHANNTMPTIWTDIVTDIDKIKTFIGATDALSLWYAWGSNMNFDLPHAFRTPAFTPLNLLANQSTAIAAANAASIHVSYYTLPLFWDSTLTAGSEFDFHNFIGDQFYGDLAFLTINDHTGAPVSDVGSDLVVLDVANYFTEVSDIQKDIFDYDGVPTPPAYGYYWGTDPVAPFTGPFIRGFYYDLFGGGGNLTTFQTDPTLIINGNSGEWETNKALLAFFVRNEIRTAGSDPEFYSSTENCEEGLVGAIDFHHLGQIGETAQPRDWGQLGWQFSTVYSRYQCFFDLSLQLNDFALTGTTQDFYYASWMNAMFHVTGGHLQLNNASRSDGTWLPAVPFTVSPGICGIFITIVFMKSCIDAMNATPAIRTYMRSGLRMRPLPASWEGRYLESHQNLSTFLGDDQGSSPANEGVVISSSVWLNPAADADYPSTSFCIGIVITSTHTADLVYNIHMQSEAYDLDPNVPKALYLRVGAVRTELTRFTDVLDYDHTVVFPLTSAPVELLEVVPV